MTPNRSPRVAALTGIAALLFSFAHVSPAAAQTVTRHAATCTAVLPDSTPGGHCIIWVPAGKVFVIESATVIGHVRSIQFVKVQLLTRVANSVVRHTVPAGFQNLSTTFTRWSGAISGVIFSEEGPLHLQISRGPESSTQASFEVTLSGRLEDM